MKNKNIYTIMLCTICAIVILGIFGIYKTIESQDEFLENIRQQDEERKKSIGEFKDHFKSLSCEQMREAIFNESIPFGFNGWAQEMYKWKPCYEVNLDD